jgi:hypothetical protein
MQPGRVNGQTCNPQRNDKRHNGALGIKAPRDGPHILQPSHDRIGCGSSNIPRTRGSHVTSMTGLLSLRPAHTLACTRRILVAHG